MPEVSSPFEKNKKKMVQNGVEALHRLSRSKAPTSGLFRFFRKNPKKEKKCLQSEDIYDIMTRRVVLTHKNGVVLCCSARILYDRKGVGMNNKIDAFVSEQLKADVTPFEIGDTVRVHNLIKEGTRERIQLFEGTVIGKHGGGISETFTVRRVAYGCGVEKTFPLHSPHVAKVDVIRKGKVRRAKLYYLRDRVGKSAKVKELM